MNPLAQEMLSEQKKLLDEMVKRIEQIQIEKDKENEPAIVAYHKYKKDFGWILNMPLSAVTLDDVVDIKVAVFSYESLPTETQKMLTEEKEQLDNLLAVANSLSPDQSADTVIKTEKEYVYLNSGNGDESQQAETHEVKSSVFVSKVVGKISRTILIAVLITSVDMLLLVISLAAYLFIRKKYRQGINIKREGAGIE